MSLLPCPFCGGDAETDTMQPYRRMSTGGGIGFSTAIYCTKCTCQLTMCHVDFPEYAPDDMLIILSEAWNMRIQPNFPKLIVSNHQR